MKRCLLILSVFALACGTKAGPKKPVLEEPGADLNAHVDIYDDDGSAADPTQEIDETRVPGDFVVTSVEVLDGPLTQDGYVTVEVYVEHPNGPSAINSAELLTADGEYVDDIYSDDGRYEFLVDWWTVDRYQTIDFDSGDSRTFAVAFFADDAQASASFLVDLSCGGLPACGGICGQTQCPTGCAATCDPDTNDSWLDVRDGCESLPLGSGRHFEEVLLSASNRTWVRPEMDSCPASLLAERSTAYYAVRFCNDSGAAGTWAFALDSVVLEGNAVDDPSLALYDGPQPPASPLQCRAVADDNGESLNPDLTTTVAAGASVIAVMTTYAAGDLGGLELTVSRAD